MKNNRNNTQVKSACMGVIIIALVVLIVFTPKMMRNARCLKQLMNNTTNIILLSVLALCITLIDPIMGVVFALLVGIVAVYLKDVDTDTLKEVESFMSLYQNPRSISQSLDKNEIKMNEMKYVENMMNYGRKHDVKTVEGMMNYGRKYNMSNRVNSENVELVEEENNTMSNNQINQEQVNVMLQKKEVNNTNLNNNTCNTHNYLTQSGPSDPTGYDVVGCRYDMTSSLQNNTVYGPPLAWCNTYDKSKVKTCGTVFYPLNG